MAEVQSNRYALITGATSGIGYELSKLFAEDGYNLIIVARTQEDLQNNLQILNSNLESMLSQLRKTYFKKKQLLNCIMR